VTRDAASKLSELVERCGSDAAAIAAARAEGDALAIEVGGKPALDWRIAVLRTTMAHPPDDDAVRELYGELCDRYRDEPASLQLLRTIGEEIRKLEADGILPSTLVARSDRRSKRKL
jgi:hypothetical protein